MMLPRKLYNAVEATVCDSRLTLIVRLIQQCHLFVTYPHGLFLGSSLLWVGKGGLKL